MQIRFGRAAKALVAMSALLPLAAACGGTGAAGASGDTITVYSADGLGSWYQERFAEFTAETGINVQLVEAGSAEVVSRVAKERGNPQADLLITLPPFIQKAAADGLLAPTGIDFPEIAESAKDPAGNYISLVDNYLNLIVNRGADPAPTSWDDLLDPRFKGKIQYSTPGQAGDGTAVLLLLQHQRGKQGALDYLAALQANNVGPSSSTGKLAPKVSNGELLVANGDVQMNLAAIEHDGANFDLMFPAGADGARTTIALPYVMGLTADAPRAEQAKRLFEFLLSAPVQDTVAPEALGTPVRQDVTPDSAVARTLRELLDGVTVWRPDWDQVLAELDADLAAYQKATGN